MKISFKPLAFTDFENLLTWLQMPHIKKWYDTDLNYTPELIQEKYGSYVGGYKKIDDESKAIHAFIIYFDDIPIGYIQYYNVYDFPRDGYELNNLPKSLAAIDMFIGDENYLSKGIGAKSLELFLESRVFNEFDYAFVDPNISNLAAIRTYENTGFNDFKIQQNKVLMITSKKVVRISTLDKVAIELTFRKHWLPDDSLWVFGSRANLDKKGGDIDLYIETNSETIDKAFEMKQKFIADLIDKIGDQKIDIVLNVVKFPEHLPIYDVARTEGIRIS